MKEIKAMIQPFLLSKVVRALQEVPNLPGLTVSEVHGFGKSKALGVAAAFEEGGVEYVKKAKLEIVVTDELASVVIGVIESHARTGSPGDGKIFVYTVDEVVKIRDGQRGDQAI